MSHKAVAWAIEQRIPSLPKLVLLMLSHRHNRDTGRCDPSVQCLADDCGMSKEAVRNALTKLEGSGHVTIVGRSDGRRQISNSYTLNMGFSSGSEPLGGSRPEPLPLVAENHRGSGSELGGVVVQNHRGVVAENDTNKGTSFNNGNRTREENSEQMPPEALARQVMQDCKVSGDKVMIALTDQIRMEYASGAEAVALHGRLVASYDDFKSCMLRQEFEITILAARFFDEMWRDRAMWPWRKGTNGGGRTHGNQPPVSAVEARRDRSRAAIFQANAHLLTGRADHAPAGVDAGRVLNAGNNPGDV